MDNESYFKHLRNASFQELQAILTADLRCPIDWTKESVGSTEHIFLEKWFYTVADYLPNGKMDASLLALDGSNYLMAPNGASFEEPYFYAEDALPLAFNTYQFKNAYRDTYQRACNKFSGLYAQPASERPKHYALGARTIDDMIKQSNRQKDIGLLLPNLHPKAQLQFFWEALANAFEDVIMSREEQYELEHPDDTPNDRDIFNAAWDEFLEPDHFRLCVDAMTTVGFSSGKEARWLVYDVSYHGKIVHCFPILSPIEGLHETALDNLQGLKEAFVEGRTDWP